ncbi:hypothetical protein [Streptomyces sp. LaBMicrA B280]
MDRGGARGYLPLARMPLSRWASADPAEEHGELICPLHLGLIQGAHR